MSYVPPEDLELLLGQLVRAMQMPTWIDPIYGAMRLNGQTLSAVTTVSSLTNLATAGATSTNVQYSLLQDAQNARWNGLVRSNII